MPRMTTINMNGTGGAVQCANVRCDSVVFECPSTNAQIIGILETGTAVNVSVLTPGVALVLPRSDRVEIKGLSGRGGGTQGNLNQFDANIAQGDHLIIRPFLT